MFLPAPVIAKASGGVAMNSLHLNALHSQTCAAAAGAVTTSTSMTLSYSRTSRRERSVECVARMSYDKSACLRRRHASLRREEAVNCKSSDTDHAFNHDGSSRFGVDHVVSRSCPLPCTVSASALPGNMPQVPRRWATPVASFTENMKILKKMGWYWGPLSIEDAEQLLNNRRDGAFLVRDSAHESYFLSLSFRARSKTFHSRIEHVGGKFSFWSQPESYSAATVVEFIEKAMDYSRRGLFQYFLQGSAIGQPLVQVSLLHPVSRFSAPFVPSLRHLCRFELLRHIRRDHINELPLPKLLIDYLHEKQYYAEYICQYNEVAENERLIEPENHVLSFDQQDENGNITHAVVSRLLTSYGKPILLQNSGWV